MPSFVMCPTCGKHVESIWQFCPFCNASLGEIAGEKTFVGVPGKSSAEADVQGDLGWIGIGQILLGVLGALGAIQSVLSGGLKSLDSFGGILMLCLLAVVIGIAVGLGSRRPGTRTATGALGAASAAGIVGCGTMALMVLATLMVGALALVIALAAMCGGLLK